MRRVSGMRGNPVPHTWGMGCPGTGKSSKQLKEVGALLGAGLHLLVQEEFYISDT